MNPDPSSHDLLNVLGVLALVLFNGFFVAAEFALVKLRDTQLDALVAKGHRQARLARHILQHLTSYLSATQLGITIASLGLGWIGEPVFASLLGPVLVALHVGSEHLRQSISFAVGFTCLTFLQIVLGELGPKWFAIQTALPVALWVARPLHWFYRVFYPFNWLLNFSASWLLRRAGIAPLGEAEFNHSEEELRVLLGRQHDGARFLGRDLVLNALDLRHRIVRDVMRPRREIVGLDTSASLAVCLEAAEQTRYSRFPLCERGNLDKSLGVVHIKDLYAMRAKAARAADLAPVAKKLIYVPETAHLEKLLQLFLERKLHFALVIDEYGGTVGMVTLENVLEEIVGQIQDEFDQEKPLLVRLNETTWTVDGALPLHELANLTGQPLAAEGIATVSGWVTHRLGGFAKTGNVIAVGDYDLRVDELDMTRVTRLVLTRKEAPAEFATN